MKNYLIVFIPLFILLFSTNSFAQRKVQYIVGETSCTIKFLPQGDMADFTGKVTWGDGSKTIIKYNQEESTNTSKFVYLEYNQSDELIGKFYFKDVYNKSGKYKDLITGVTSKVKLQ